MSFKGPKRKRGLKSHLQDGRKVYDISDSDDDEPMAPMDQSPLAGPSNHYQGKEVINISDSDEDPAPSSAASVPSISTPKASQSSTLHGSQPRYQRFHPRTPSPSVVPETPPLSDDDDSDDEPPVRLDKGKGRAEPRLSTESRGVFSRSIIEVYTDDEEEQDQEDETEREDEETVSPRVLRVRKKTKGKPLDVAGLLKNLPREDVKRVVAVLTKAKEESKRTSKRARTSTSSRASSSFSLPPSSTAASSSLPSHLNCFSSRGSLEPSISHSGSSRGPSSTPFSASGRVNEADLDLDEDEDDGGFELNSVPMRRARNVTLLTSNGKKDKFSNVENGSGHRFNATVSSWNDPEDDVDIQSDVILDADVYEKDGIIRIWILTEIAWYQVDSVTNFASIEDFFVTGALAELVVAIGKKATFRNFEALLSYQSSIATKKFLGSSDTWLREAEIWLRTTGSLRTISSSNVLSNLGRLLPEIKRSMHYHQWDQDERSPLIIELIRVAQKRHVKLQHRRAPTVVDSLPPLVLPVIQELAGDLFGDLKSLPNTSQRTGPRSKVEEDVFVESADAALKNERIDWTEPFRINEEGVLEACFMGRKTELKVGDFIAVEPVKEQVDAAFPCSGPMSGFWYGRILAFETTDEAESDSSDDDDDLSNTQVRISWYYHASSRFGGRDGFYLCGSFANPRELVRSDSPSDSWPLSMVLRPISVELCTAIPVDTSAMFFSRLTYNTDGSVVSTASLENPKPMLVDPVTPLRVLDAYAGAGGLGLGMLLGAGGRIEIPYAVEANPNAAKSYAANHPNTKVFNELVGVILQAQLDPDEKKRLIKGQIHCVLGGPPCQGFSTANTSRHAYDPRVAEMLVYLSLCFLLAPSYIIIENVPGIETYRLPSAQGKPGGTMLEFINRIGMEHGYQFAFSKLNAASYGAAQSRERVIIIGTKMGSVLPTFPEATHGPEKHQQPFVTVSDAISDLPLEGWTSAERVTCDLRREVEYLCDPTSDFQRFVRRGARNVVSLHTTPGYKKLSVKRALAIPKAPGSSLKDLSAAVRDLLGLNVEKKQTDSRTFRRLYGNLPSPTITGQMGMNSFHSQLHPDCDRAITLRERLRLQGFPDNYKLFGGAGSLALQIGNCVPVFLSMALGRHLFGRAPSVMEDLVEVVI